MGPWLEFAGDTASSDQIAGGLDVHVIHIEQSLPM
jgi:hypothetical protein